MNGVPPEAVLHVIAHQDAALAEELGLLIDGATSYAIYMLDSEGRVTIWNRGAERIKGWTEGEIVGSSFSIFYPPHDVVAGKPALDLARAAALGRFEEESWRLRQDGSEFLASVTMTALHDEAGALRGYGKVVRDITDQKAAEAAVMRREHHLRSILATVPDAMIVTDEHGTMSSFSTAAEEMFGYSSVDVVGRNVDMMMPSLEAVGATHVAAAARTATARRADGQVFPIELTIGEALIAGERIFTVFVRDLTSRHETDRKVAELQAELVHVSRLSAMGTMASTLAHEINQPLTAIANYLQATRAMIGATDDALLGEIAEALDLAAAQSLRAGTIVRHLRAFVERGDTGSRPEPLGPLVEEAASLGLLGAREAGIEVTMSLAAGLDRVMVDRVQIQQVLVNLIRNAIQSMAASPRKNLSVATAHERPGWVRVTIADTGSGLDPAIRDRLFNAFATTKEDGMGLGLSISRTIIEAYGGRIWAEHNPGGGTAFQFCVPLAGDNDG